MPRTYDTYAAQRARADDTRWPGARDLHYDDPMGTIAAGSQLHGLFEGIPILDELGNLIPAPITQFFLGLIDDIPILGDFLQIILGITDDGSLDPTTLLSGFFDGLRTFLPFLPDMGGGIKSVVEGAADFITGILNPANLLAFFNPGLIPGLDASIITSGFFDMDLVSGLPATFLSIGAGLFNAVFGAGSSTATTVAQATAEAEAAVKNLNGRVVQLEGGRTITTYTVSGTWTNPTPTQHNLITVICICGGDGGGRPQTSTGDTAKGGQSGGYMSKQFYTDEIPATVAMTIGAGGAGASSAGNNGGSGGATSFGSLLVGAKGVGAAFRDGSFQVAVPPGNGGNGGWSYESLTSPFPRAVVASQPGSGSGFAPGGRPGFSSSGAAGSASPANIPAGGGGGGGGSETGAGGIGGFPGGGGGAGGINIQSGSGSSGVGAAGASGCIYIVTG